MTTLGRKRVNLNENQSEPEHINLIRLKIAGLIDELEFYKGDVNTNPTSKERERVISIAQTKLEEACMFAVKSFYTK